MVLGTDLAFTDTKLFPQIIVCEIEIVLSFGKDIFKSLLLFDMLHFLDLEFFLPKSNFFVQLTIFIPQITELACSQFKKQI
jgi:hypothetical protein